jgi:signal transduction histidine kinase
MPPPRPSIAEAAESLPMRWPIHRQLLLPMVSVVLLASILATAITACWIAVRVRNEQRESLSRVVKKVGEAPFPLTEPVLIQMRGLSGAEFVLMTFKGRLLETTLPVERPWLNDLSKIVEQHSTDGEKTAIISLGECDYWVDFVNISRRSGLAEPATLFILYPEDQLTSHIHQAVYPALIAGLIAAGIAVGITTWLARRFARPIHTLVARTATIAQGDFTPMPIARRNDELRDLAESINRMTEQLADYEGQVRRNERLKTLGQLGAAMAHQLRNAATGGRMAIELHRRDCPQGSADESLDVALRQLRLMESYLRQFLSIGGPAADIREQVNTTLLVKEVLGLVRPSYLHAGIELQFEPPAQPVFLQGDPESLRQLATNLVLNAAEAAVSGQSVPPRVQIEIVRKSDKLGSLCVRDSGPGPEASIRDQLFESFVTTKPDGFGLGLYVARQIAERHGGKISWRREGGTTCFELEFPIVGKESERNNHGRE